MVRGSIPLKGESFSNEPLEVKKSIASKVKVKASRVKSASKSVVASERGGSRAAVKQTMAPKMKPSQEDMWIKTLIS